MKLENLEEKFEKLYTTFTNQSFLQMEALGGEIPFYITSFNPTQKKDIEKKINQLKNRLKRKGIVVCELNLFELIIEILANRNILEKIIKQESSLTKDRLHATIDGAIDTEKYLVPHIDKKIKENSSKIIFITGIGQAYPLIRSHGILNNLQNTIKDRPVVMFYPGIFNGSNLSLFGKLKDDNYYRAFNLETLNLA